MTPGVNLLQQALEADFGIFFVSFIVLNFASAQKENNLVLVLPLVSLFFFFQEFTFLCIFVVKYIHLFYALIVVLFSFEL